MPATPLPEELEEFLAGARACVLATVRPDGSPVTVACWYEYEGGRVLLSMGREAKRLEHIRTNPRIALTVLGEDWYQHVSLLCHVVEMRDDDNLELVDRLSMRYLGEPFFEREPAVEVVAEVDRWHTYGFPV